MARSVVSVCHGLRLVPLSRIIRFVRIQSRVHLVLLGGPVDILEIPGSVTVSATSDNGMVKKKITFERSDVSDITADLLEGFRFSRFIATYVDESGKRRVAGSPDWPLSLDFTIEGGAFAVTIKGEDIHTDGFLVDSSPSEHL